MYLGLIANVRDGGDPDDIQLVKELAETYIQRANSLILLVISAESSVTFRSHCSLTPI